jgi:hypothetical protein
MPYINAAQISGNLGKDAETMTTRAAETLFHRPHPPLHFEASDSITSPNHSELDLH